MAPREKPTANVLDTVFADEVNEAYLNIKAWSSCLKTYVANGFPDTVHPCHGHQQSHALSFQVHLPDLLHQTFEWYCDMSCLPMSDDTSSNRSVFLVGPNQMVSVAGTSGRKTASR